MLTYCTLKPACNQVQLHPKCCQPDLLRFLFDKGILPVGYSPLGKLGLSSGAANIVDDPLVVQMAEKYGKEPVQIVLNWGLCRGYPVIPRSTQLKNQVTNLGAVNFKMSAEDVKAVAQKLDCNLHLFIAPEENPYNLFA